MFAILVILSSLLSPNFSGTTPTFDKYESVAMSCPFLSVIFPRRPFNVFTRTLSFSPKSGKMFLDVHFIVWPFPSSLAIFTLLSNSSSPAIVSILVL